MNKFKNLNYFQKIAFRIKASWMILILMLIYMVVITEIGGGDSRIMTDLANTVSDIIFFGGMIYIMAGIVHNKKLLKNRVLLEEQMRKEQDERSQFLHDKSGGITIDILLILELFITVTTALFNMPAFYTAFTILLVTLFLKAAAYVFYSHSK